MTSSFSPVLFRWGISVICPKKMENLLPFVHFRTFLYDWQNSYDRFDFHFFGNWKKTRSVTERSPKKSNRIICSHSRVLFQHWLLAWCGRRLAQLLHSRFVFKSRIRSLPPPRGRSPIVTFVSFRRQSGPSYYETWDLRCSASRDVIDRFLLVCDAIDRFLLHCDAIDRFLLYRRCRQSLLNQPGLEERSKGFSNVSCALLCCSALNCL